MGRPGAICRSSPPPPPPFSCTHTHTHTHTHTQETSFCLGLNAWRHHRHLISCSRTGTFSTTTAAGYAHLAGKLCNHQPFNRTQMLSSGLERCGRQSCRVCDFAMAHRLTSVGCAGTHNRGCRECQSQMRPVPRPQQGLGRGCLRLCSAFFLLPFHTLNHAVMLGRDHPAYRGISSGHALCPLSVIWKLPHS